MRVGSGLSIFSQVINIIIFFYFIITLLKLNVLDIIGLLISAFGILMSLAANIASALEGGRRV